MTPAIAALIKCGVVMNKCKNMRPHKNVYTLAGGDKNFYDFLDDNSSISSGR